MNRKLKIILGIMTLICILIVSMFFILRNKFFASTINGISVNYLTESEAEYYINNFYKTKKFIYIGKQKIAYFDIIKSPIKIPTNLKKHFSSNKIDLELRDDFYEIVNKNRTVESIEPNIEKKNDKLVMQPRIIGDRLDRDKLKHALENALNGGKDVFMENELIHMVEDNTNYYEIEKKVVSLKNKTFIVTFKGISSIEEKLKFSDIEKFIDVDRKDNVFNISFNKDKVLNYVKKLDEEYRTIYRAYQYRSTEGESVELKNNQGIGFDLDYKKSVDEIIRCLEEEDENIVLPLDKNISKLTSTYVEISLAKQRMRIVKDGNVVLETSVVTGKDKTPTNRGVFLIYSKEKNRILKGLNDDGSKYAVSVKYWLPFDGGIGIHDTNRPMSDYVVDTYHKRGSHGCINTPNNIMSQVYDYLEVNYHVVVI